MHALNASTGVQAVEVQRRRRSVCAFPRRGEWGGVCRLSATATLYALNASTGAKLWSYPSRRRSRCFRAARWWMGWSMSRAGDSTGDRNFGACGVRRRRSRSLPAHPDPLPATVQQGDLLHLRLPGLEPGSIQRRSGSADHASTGRHHLRLYPPHPGTPGLGACTTPPYQGTGQIVCSENAVMAPNTTWTVRLTVKVTAPSGTVITANAATMSDTFDPEYGQQHCDSEREGAVSGESAESES